MRLFDSLESSPTGVPLFEVVVEWEYTVIPTHAVQRFTCVADLAEFRELVSDVPATLTWLVPAWAGLEAAAQETYELLFFAVDGKERPIRRQARKSGQTYSASIGQDVVEAGKPVRIRQVYRTMNPRAGHRLFVEVGQPTRNLSIELDYSYTDISQMSVTDLVSSSHRSQVSRMPKEVDAQVLSIDLPGWHLPKSGCAFTWTLASEQSALPATRSGARPTKS